MSPSMRRDLMTHVIGVLDVLCPVFVVDARPCGSSMSRHSSDGGIEKDHTVVPI